MTNRDIVRQNLDMDVVRLVAAVPNATKNDVGLWTAKTNFPVTGLNGPQFNRYPNIIETRLRVVEFVSWSFPAAYYNANSTGASTCLFHLSTTKDFNEQNTVEFEVGSVATSYSYPTPMPKLEGNYRYLRLFQDNNWYMTYFFMFHGRK